MNLTNHTSGQLCKFVSLHPSRECLGLRSLVVEVLFDIALKRAPWISTMGLPRGPGDEWSIAHLGPHEVPVVVVYLFREPVTQLRKI